MQLVGADALLAGHHEVDGLEHLVERHAGMLEHGAHLHGELLTALATLLEAVTHDAFGVLDRGLRTDARQIVHTASDHAAMRAGNPIGPNDAFQKRESLSFVVEVGRGKNRHGEALRRGF
jgi:hypothetical protein